MSEFRQVRAEDVRQNLINLKQLVFEVTDACNLIRCKYCAYYDLYAGNISPYHEVLGYVAIEMLMHELPITCSHASGLMEIVENGASGSIFE